MDVILNKLNNKMRIFYNKLLITEDKNRLNDEIEYNTRSINFAKKTIKAVPWSELAIFLRSVINYHSEQLARENKKALFYCWYDELATLLKVCFISADHEKLPFGCAINFVDNIEDIIAMVRQDKNKGELPWNQLKILDLKDLEEIDEETIEENNFILDVYCQKIP